MKGECRETQTWAISFFNTVTHGLTLVDLMYTVDLLDQIQSAPGPPSSDPPDLENLASKNQLREHVTAMIHASVKKSGECSESHRPWEAFSHLSVVRAYWSTGLAEAGSAKYERKVSSSAKFCHSSSERHCGMALCP